jgi:hypothetical protein
METKKWYQSKLIWLAIVTFLTALAPLVVDLVTALVPSTQTVATAIGGFAVGFLTVVFRVVTDTTIE